VPELDAMIPLEPNKPYDIKDVIRAVVDDAHSSRCTRTTRRTSSSGSRGVDGRPVGVVANQPAVLAGVLDIDASVKGARFVRFCDCFNIPLVTFVDVPGFLPGRPGARRHHHARREAALRLRRGDGAEDHRDHSARPTAAPTTSWRRSTSGPT
jgi:acetyl-CoA carboxylase carboxyltransferase component